jgi:hypothetical protein
VVLCLGLFGSFGLDDVISEFVSIMGKMYEQ